MSVKLPAPFARRPQIVLFRLGIYACFFFSGATSLLFEVLWSRQFVTVFGNSSYAISIVLCAYMAGIGLGGLLGGRLADSVTRRTLAFALVQAAVALCALAIPPMLDWMRLFVPTLPALSPHSLLVSTLARFALSFAILVVPCFLMGTTLPLLVRVVTDSDKTIGSRIGLLYCVNTLGAALGCLAGGFWMIGTFGLRGTNQLAVGVNFVIAILALALSRRADIALSAIPTPPLTPHTERIDHNEEPEMFAQLLLALAFLNGFAGLACEVLWIRYMSFIVSSTYVFPTILCVYLLGAGLGGLIYGLLAGRTRPPSVWWVRRPALTLGVLEMLLALSVPATFITSALLFAGGPPPPLDQKGMALLAVFLPTILMGMAFPLLCAVYGRRVQTLGRRTGLLFAVNTAGTVLGALLPIFVFIPFLGIQKSLWLISALYGVMGLALLAFANAKDRLAMGTVLLPATITYAVVLFLLFAMVPADLCQRVFLTTDFALAKHTDILFYREGRTGTAIVTRNRINNCRTVYINGVSEVPILYPHLLCFKMIGDLAPMLHPKPDDVLMICFGGGVAAGATSVLPEVKSLTIVDLEKSVVKAAALLSQENNGLLQNPKANVVIDDGRNFIMTSTKKWPVIVSDSTHPKSGDSWVLYTQEFYQQVRDHLTDDGVFVEWVPIHGLCIDEFKIITRTFQSVFPHASMWVVHGVDEQARFVSYVLLLATPEPLKIDVAKLQDRLNAEPVRRDLQPYGLHTPVGFLDSFLCAEDSLRRWTGDGPVNTDDLPFTQYVTRYSQGPAFRNADFIEPMEDIWPCLTNAGSEDSAKQLHEALKLRAEANRFSLTGRLDKAYAVLPDDVRYQQMRRLYEQGPSYVQALVDIYRDNPKVLELLALLRLSGPSGLQATAPIHQRILKLDPKNVNSLNSLGAICINANLLPQAENYLALAVQLAPDSVTARYNLGLVFYRTGRPQLAIPHLRYCLDKDPNDQTSRGILANIEQAGKTPPPNDIPRDSFPGRPRN
ncbi:MAG: tetratricopeptide repeat protein [Sedimentisphaerales bacterium]